MTETASDLAQANGALTSFLRLGRLWGRHRGRKRKMNQGLRIWIGRIGFRFLPMVSKRRDWFSTGVTGLDGNQIFNHGEHEEINQQKIRADSVFGFPVSLFARDGRSRGRSGKSFQAALQVTEEGSIWPLHGTAIGGNESLLFAGK